LARNEIAKNWVHTYIRSAQMRSWQKLMLWQLCKYFWQFGSGLGDLDHFLAKNGNYLEK
jgi:hypothetical protein